MALFSKAIKLSINSQEKYFDVILNMDIEFIKKNLKNRINCFSYNEKINKFIRSIITHKLIKDINTKSVK